MVLFQNWFLDVAKYISRSDVLFNIICFLYFFKLLIKFGFNLNFFPDIYLKRKNGCVKNLEVIRKGKEESEEKERRG